MIKCLLVIMAALSMLSAGAQSKNVDVVVPQQPRSVYHDWPNVEVREMQKRAPGEAIVNKQKASGEFDLHYRRPAGAFPSIIVVEDGEYDGVLRAPYIAATPYVDYTFNVVTSSSDVNQNFWWIYEAMGEFHEVESRDLTVSYGYEVCDVPLLEYSYQYPFFLQHEPGVVQPSYTSSILAVPSTMQIWNKEYLKSSKAMFPVEIAPNQVVSFISYTGAEPDGKGYWFGKNGFHDVENPSYFVDGIAQAFEQPTAPYLLKQVVVSASPLKVAAPIEMKCRVYKLDKIPAYIDDDEAFLPEEPDELIAMGKAEITPESANAPGGLIFFTLYGEEDGLEYEITPTIDCPILVVVDGYNDPEMENLQSFSAMIGTDFHHDEGFGELAYLKFGTPRDDGSVEYQWAGLNNFFASGEMKTGFSIFLNTENPYLTFNHTLEDGEYTFPIEGSTISIEFWSWTPSADDGWYVFSNNGDEVPDWLSIELEDEMRDGEFTGLVTATVVAEPLPPGITYREAIVRFAIPGNYSDYKFMQGKIGHPCDPGDGEVTIADVNFLIDLIISGMYDNCYDVNGDGELTIADVDMVINYILTN